MVRDIDHAKPIVEYLKKNLSKGYKPQNLKWALINEGYSRIEVDKAMKLVEDEMLKEKQIAELRARKEAEKQAAQLITEEMPENVEKPGFFSKIKSWFD